MGGAQNQNNKSQSDTGGQGMNGKDFLIGTMVGAFIGATTALLLSPKSGKELREDISAGYQTASQKTQHVAKNVSQQTEAMVGQVKDTIDHLKEDVQEWKEINDEATDNVIDSTEDEQNQAAASLDHEEQSTDK